MKVAHDKCDIGMIKLIKETPNKDGGVTWELEYTEDFKSLYKKITDKKRATKKGMAAWFLEVVEKYAREKE